jgi:hypothetical protein
MLGASFGERINAMNDDTTTLDQADEDILTYTVSDEALEAAAGTAANTATQWNTVCLSMGGG